MAHIKMLKIIFKSIRQLGSFTLCSSVTNSTHQPIKKLSVFSDTDAGNKLKLWQKLTWKIFRLTKGKKLKSYNIQFKLDAIKLAEESSNHSASGKFGVAVKTIREWRGNKDQLEKLRQCSNGAKRFRVDGADEKPLAPEMEDVLLVDDKETDHEESPTFT